MLRSHLLPLVQGHEVEQSLSASLLGDSGVSRDTAPQQTAVTMTRRRDFSRGRPRVSIQQP